MIKLLIRRYVTSEQRRRNDYSITEDDIVEVRQDISTLRYELLDIFHNNNYKINDIEKKMTGKQNKEKTIKNNSI